VKQVAVVTSKREKDKHCMNKVTSRRVRAAAVTVEKQKLLIKYHEFVL
jgi:hypothetical protein